MQLAGDPSPFVFLRFDQLSRKHLQRVLRELSFANISGHALHAHKGAVFVDRTAAYFDRHATTVFRDHVDFVRCFTFSRELRAETGAYLLDVLRCDKLAEVVTNDFVACVSGKRLAARFIFT